MAGANRRVLMLCYYYPPIISSGVARSRAFAKLLSAAGWTPVVLTVSTCRDPWVKIGTETGDEVRVERSREWNLAWLVDTGHAILMRLAGLIGIRLASNHLRDLLCIPDTQIAWFSTWAGVRLAREVEVIYVSCSPFSSALSGVLIKRLSGKPLVLDFRDAWTLNQHTKAGRLHRAVIGRMERAVVRHADRLVLNTEAAARLYRAKYPAHAARFRVIPNGYDELTPVARVQESDDVFRIMHIGSFYGARSPALLLEALSELPECNIEFVQVGGPIEAVEQYRNRVKIRTTGAVPRAEALGLMATASLLYLKQGWEPGVKDYIAVAAKTYEYLATGIPILADVPPGENAEIVRRYAGRSWVVTSHDKEELKAAVRAAYASRAEPRIGVTRAFEETYSRQDLTRRLAAVFQELVDVAPPGVGAASSGQAGP